MIGASDGDIGHFHHKSSLNCLVHASFLEHCREGKRGSSKNTKSTHRKIDKEYSRKLRIKFFNKRVIVSKLLVTIILRCLFQTPQSFVTSREFYHEKLGQGRAEENHL